MKKSKTNSILTTWYFVHQLDLDWCILIYAVYHACMWLTWSQKNTADFHTVAQVFSFKPNAKKKYTVHSTPTPTTARMASFILS
jgi:hypothetical protein